MVRRRLGLLLGVEAGQVDLCAHRVRVLGAEDAATAVEDAAIERLGAVGALLVLIEIGELIHRGEGARVVLADRLA